MDSDLHQQCFSGHSRAKLLHQQSNHQHKTAAASLTRYSSAPSSYFPSFRDGEELITSSSYSETARVLSNLDGDEDSLRNVDLVTIKEDSPAKRTAKVTASTSMFPCQQGSYNGFSQTPSRFSPNFLDQNGIASPMLMEPKAAVDGGAGGGSSNLAHHSSLPAGFFANVGFGVESGYRVYRGLEDYSCPPHSLMMTPFSENGEAGDGKCAAIDSWNEMTIIPGMPSMSNSNIQKTSAEMAAILQLQESTPCKIRAKRGCATHPRSIAERVRRTRISERMRKLQDLVPNMDKQANTAEMLDFAVDYIKDLQRQVKVLSDTRALCMCNSACRQ